MSGYVYAIRTDFGPVKLGYARCPWRRLIEHQKRYDFPLYPIGCVPATTQQEDELHHLLRQQRDDLTVEHKQRLQLSTNGPYGKRHEWYYRSPIVEHAISMLRDWPAPSEAMARKLNGWRHTHLRLSA